MRRTAHRSIHPGFAARPVATPSTVLKGASAFAKSVVAVLAATAAVIASGGAPTPAAAQEGPPGRYVDLVFPSATRTNGIRYGAAIDKPTGRSVDLRLDLYEATGDTVTRRPVFVFLFGGGFVSGDREREPRAYCEQMARRGYVSAAIDYRLNQGNIFQDGIPAAVSDARQALRWLRANADRYRLDVDRIVIGGSSAGAITSLFVAYTDVERGTGDGPPDVAAVVDLWGGLYTEIRQMQAGEPALVIIHGTADRVVPFTEAEKLRDRATEVGIAHLFHPLAGQGHAPYMPSELMAVAAPFLFEQLWTTAPTLTVTPLPPTDRPTDTATPEPTGTPTPERTVTTTPERTITTTPERTITPTPERTITPAPERTVSPTPTSVPIGTPPTDAGRVFLPAVSPGG